MQAMPNVVEVQIVSIKFVVPLQCSIDGGCQDNLMRSVRMTCVLEMSNQLCDLAKELRSCSFRLAVNSVGVAMRLITFEILGFYFGSVGHVGAQPIFPDGVAPIMKSISARQKTILSSAGDDKDEVRELVRGGSVAVHDGLLEEAAKSDLQQVGPLP